MKTFLFLDDWFLDNAVDIQRRFCRATPVALPEGVRLARYHVIYDPLCKRFRAWGKDRMADTEAKLRESEDGIDWHDTGARLKTPKLLDFYEQAWMVDPQDQQKSRRYKMTCWPYDRAIKDDPGFLAVSPDGKKWKIERQYKWFTLPNGSDTSNHLFYNPFRQAWSVFCRKRNTDRRIFVTESRDLVHWTLPRLVLHPDALDPAFFQLYGMIAQPYAGDYLIGALQCFHVPGDDPTQWMDGRIKMYGVTDTQLTYSYEGEHWIRSDRTPLIERLEPGHFGHGGLYTTGLAIPEQGDIYLYSLAYLMNHGPGPFPPGITTTEALVLHKLRRDGFAYLEPTGGFGRVLTRTLVPRQKTLALNYQAPAGTVLVQLCGTTKKPIPGYTFTDCLPLRGDAVEGKVTWKRRRDLAPLIGKPIKIEVQMLDARLYAIKLDSGLWFGNTPGPVERLG